MKLVLDANPPDFEFAIACARREEFVVVVQGDPAVAPRLIHGIAHVKRNIAAKWSTVEYEVDGETLIVSAPDVLSFSKDYGIQQWDTVRLNGPTAEAILAAWPGPIAREILAYCGVDDETARWLRQWYRNVGTDWVLAERAI